MSPNNTHCFWLLEQTSNECIKENIKVLTVFSWVHSVVPCLIDFKVKWLLVKCSNINSTELYFSCRYQQNCFKYIIMLCTTRGSIHFFFVDLTYKKKKCLTVMEWSYPIWPMRLSYLRVCGWGKERIVWSFLWPETESGLTTPEPQE